MHIQIDGIPIEILRKPIKNLNLRIYPPDGLVKVSVPLKYSEQLIKQRLQEKVNGFVPNASEFAHALFIVNHHFKQAQPFHSKVKIIY